MRHVDHLQRLGDRALGLHADVLVPRGLAVAQRQHDRADHRHQQHQAGGLEQEDVVGVEQPPERRGVADLRRRRRQTQRGGVGRELPAAEHQRQFDEQHRADRGADRQIALEAAAQLGEVDVEHHHDEQEQHRDRADIDDDQDHRQELGAGDQEQCRGVEERQDQEQHRMHRIARR